MRPSYTYAATVLRVVDGDTIDVEVDLGFRVTTRQRVRLNGVNAPEHNTAEGQTAIRWVHDWLARHTPSAAVVITSSKPGGGDKYGRFLAAIATGDGHDLATDLIAAGYAAPWDGTGAKPVPQEA